MCHFEEIEIKLINIYFRLGSKKGREQMFSVYYQKIVKTKQIKNSYAIQNQSINQSIYITLIQGLYNLGVKYMYICLLKKVSFRGPGGVVGGLDSGYRAKICVRELAFVVSRGHPVISRGLPPLDIQIRSSKFGRVSGQISNLEF